MIIKRDTYDNASKIYYNAVYEKQDIDSYIEKHPKDGLNDRFIDERETRSKLLKCIVDSLDEYKTRLGLTDGRGLILIVDRLELTKENLESAEDYLLSRKEKLAYCQKVFRNLSDCPKNEIYEGELEESLEEIERLKAEIETLEKFKERLNLAS